MNRSASIRAMLAEADTTIEDIVMTLLITPRSARTGMWCLTSIGHAVRRGFVGRKRLYTLTEKGRRYRNRYDLSR